MKRTPLRSVSPKRRKQNVERTALRKAQLEQHPNCEAFLGGCDHRAVDVHEIINRSQNPLAFLTPELFLSLCRPCHSYITTHPDFAWHHGYTLKVWQLEFHWIRLAKDLRAPQCARDRRCTVPHMTYITDQMFYPDEE